MNPQLMTREELIREVETFRHLRAAEGVRPHDERDWYERVLPNLRAARQAAGVPGFENG